MTAERAGLQTQTELVALEERKPLRIALTISGAVALGAFEGGALAALLTAVQRATEERPGCIRIDAIGGASAGAITGVLAARTLHAGLDARHVMWKAWVEDSSLSALMSQSNDAPLSTDVLEKSVADLLDPLPEHRGRGRQTDKILMEMTLANLRGLTYGIPRLRAKQDDTTPVQPIDAHTHLDWGKFTFKSDDTLAAYTQPEAASAIAFALASGANALGFLPRLLRRNVREEDLNQQLKHPIKNFPTSGSMWYTDGGTIDNEPLGRTLDLANDLDRDGVDARRLHLLIHPHPMPPPLSSEPRWSGDDQPPRWTPTAYAAFNLRGSQGIYDDLRRVEKTNSRLIWRNALIDALRGHLDEEGARNLAALVLQIQNDKVQMMSSIEGESRSSPSADPLKDAIDAVAGLGGKDTVMVEEITPSLVLNEGVRIEDVLAGEFLMHFGGFLDENLRRSDFALGYECMVRWLHANLGNLIDEGVAARAVEFADSAYANRPADLADGKWGKTSLKSLDVASRKTFRGMGLHVLDVVAGDARPWTEKSVLRKLLVGVVRPVARFMAGRLLKRVTGG
jgi:predicted acylesterase/phospholipase RssA